MIASEWELGRKEPWWTDRVEDIWRDLAACEKAWEEAKSWSESWARTCKIYEAERETAKKALSSYIESAKFAAEHNENWQARAEKAEEMNAWYAKRCTWYNSELECTKARAEKAEAVAKYNANTLDASSKQLLAEIQMRTKAEAERDVWKAAANKWATATSEYAAEREKAEDERDEALRDVKQLHDAAVETEDKMDALVAALRKVLDWRGLDGDGISDPLRADVAELLRRVEG
jgi:chromosome segregation ATPase